jgi:hypothetical protein
MLDNSFGLYPFVTASNVIEGGVNIGSGVPSKKIDEVWGVVKAYTPCWWRTTTHRVLIRLPKIFVKRTQYGTTTVDLVGLAG